MLLHHPIFQLDLCDSLCLQFSAQNQKGQVRLIQECSYCCDTMGLQPTPLSAGSKQLTELGSLPAYRLFSISTTSIGTRLDLQCSRNHFLRWALLKWWSASLDLYPVPSSCKALVGGIRSWRTSFFVVFSFRLGNWLSSVQNLLPYLLYSQVDKGSHNGWGWAEWRTTPKSSQTRRSLAPVPPPWDLLVEPWHGQGWPGQKSWKRWPNVHAVDEPNGIRMLQRPNQIEADAATKLQDIASEVNSPRTTVPNTSR